MKLKPNVPAARALAILAPSADAAAAAYAHAWDVWGALDASSDPSAHQLGADLASEYGGWLLGNERWDQLEALRVCRDRLNGEQSMLCFAKSMPARHWDQVTNAARASTETVLRASGRRPSMPVGVLLPDP